MVNGKIRINGLRAQIAALNTLGVEWGEFQGKAVGSDVEYAIYVEYGTYKMEANRGLRDSIQATMGLVDGMAKRADSADHLAQMIAKDIAEGYRARVWVDTGRLRASIEVREK